MTSVFMLLGQHVKPLSFCEQRDVTGQLTNPSALPLTTW